MNRRHALTLVAAAPLALAAGCAGRTIPIPDDADAIFADVAAAIDSAEALVSFAEASGWVGPDTIAQARGLIAKARGYLADAKAALGTGARKDLANLALRVLTGIVFSGGLGVAEAGKPALTMTIRK